MMDDKVKLAIVGSGTVGRQLAIFLALKKFNVILISRNENAREVARTFVEGKLSSGANQNALFPNIRFSSNLPDIMEATLVFEAVNEDIEVKKKVLSEIESIVSDETIIGSNTSSISIERLAEGLDRKHQFLGIHFFNPVAKMRLVEVVRSSKTSDSPAFIVNRVLMPLINEASMLVQEGNDPKTIDDAIKLGLNHPMGPLELADLIGIDICVQIMQNIAEQIKNEKYLPSDQLKMMIDRGNLGRKSGKGFYSYAQRK
jgi:3-hydroxybutyryl-CoA dehydrogenase